VSDLSAQLTARDESMESEVSDLRAQLAARDESREASTDAAIAALRADVLKLQQRCNSSEQSLALANAHRSEEAELRRQLTTENGALLTQLQAARKSLAGMREARAETERASGEVIRLRQQVRLLTKEVTKSHADLRKLSALIIESEASTPLPKQFADSDGQDDADEVATLLAKRNR
jgi:chromosome segregation ATPase